MLTKNIIIRIRVRYMFAFLSNPWSISFFRCTNSIFPSWIVIICKLNISAIDNLLIHSVFTCWQSILQYQFNSIGLLIYTLCYFTTQQLDFSRQNNYQLINFFQHYIMNVIYNWCVILGYITNNRLLETYGI